MSIPHRQGTTFNLKKINYYLLMQKWNVSIPNRQGTTNAGKPRKKNFTPEQLCQFLIGKVQRVVEKIAIYNENGSVNS